jgi:hypothetical protein
MGESVRRGEGDPSKTVVENVLLSKERIQLGSEFIRDVLDDGRLTVKCAVYSMGTGVIRWID